MNNAEIKKMAIKELNTKPIQNLKKQLCRLFTNERARRGCSSNFDKGYIKSFIHSYQIERFKYPNELLKI